MATTHSVTADSIAAAKQAASAERTRIFEATGIRIRDDGSIVRPLVIIHCPRQGCRFAASAQTEGRAIRGLSAHTVRVHQKEA